MKECIVHNCKNNSNTAGMCNAHYIRMRRYGSTDERPRPDFFERFLNIGWTVDNECWIWNGMKNSTNGYGRIRGSDGYKVVYAHRASYDFFNGDLVEGLEILHSCDAPACVNPDHLRQGTSRENSLDMISRNRSASYENKLLQTCKSGVHDITQPGALKEIKNGSNKYGQVYTKICVQCRKETQRRWNNKKKGG